MECCVLRTVLQSQISLSTANQHLWGNKNLYYLKAHSLKSKWQNENRILTKYIHKNINCKATSATVGLTKLRAEIHKAFSLPTVFVCPFSAAIIKGVFPEESTAFTWALWPSRSCRHSTWSVKAAACRGVLQQIKRQFGHVQPCFLLYSKGHPWLWSHK